MFIFGKKKDSETTKQEIIEKMMGKSKGDVIPLWAISEAAESLKKHKLVDDDKAEMERMVEELKDGGYTVVDVSRMISERKNLTPKKAENKIWDDIVLSVGLAFKYAAERDPAPEIQRAAYIAEIEYYFWVENATMNDARQIVRTLIDDALALVRKGEIG